MTSSSEEDDYEINTYYNSENFTKSDSDSAEAHPATHCIEAACVILLISNVIIFLLGIVGNGAVIWIAGFKMKKSVNTTWYMSLALSDFIFCSTIPLTIVNIAIENWLFGLFMCKFTSFIMYVNMYSSIFLLVIISVDRCLTVKFPVWAQNYRSVAKASAVVVLAWFVSALLSIPPVKFRVIRHHSSTVTVCYNNYEDHHHTVVIVRFTLGFLIPFLSICLCYSILICKLRVNQISKSNKPYKIMTLLIVTFFLCWLPFHIVAIIELNKSQHSQTFYRAQQAAATLACSNSFLNPILYAFMAKDLKKKCFSFLSKIERTIDQDESRSAFRGTTVTNSGDHGLSTAV